MRKLFMGFAAWVILGGAVLAFLVIRRKCRTENLFLVLGLTWGMFFVIFFPPNTAPDENAHIATAYSNADRIMGREAEDEQGKVSVRASDLNIPVMTDVSRKTFNMVYEKWQEPVNDQAVSYIRGRLGTPIVAHLPQTIGVVLGWLTGQGAVQTLYLGKFMGLLFYIFCVYWAIRFIPWGKMSLMLIALFPMSLELAGSFSYDCLVNALCFLFIGYTMHLIYKKEIVTWKDILFLAAIAGIMAPCKIAYIFVCGICFLIPKKKFRKNSILSDDVQVKEGAKVVDSVIMPGATIGKNVQITKAIIGENAIIGDDAVVDGSEEIAVVGYSEVIGVLTSESE